MGGHEQVMTFIFLSLSKLECGSQEINSRGMNLPTFDIFNKLE